MYYRQIGNQGPAASVMGLGSWNTYSRLEFDEAVELIGTAAQEGIGLFDISYYPDKPYSEVIFGRILQAAGLSRESYLVQEKLWLSAYPELSLQSQLERSLRRLGMDYVDIVMVESPKEGAPVGQLTSEVAALVETGKAGVWGAVNWSPEDLQWASEHCAAAGIPGPQIVQLKYSVARRHVVDEEFDKVLAETGISLQPSDVLEGGILAGVKEPRRPIGQDPGGIRDQIISLVPELRAVASSLDATPAQLCIAFCLANRHTANVVFGATKISTLRENLAAADLLERHGGDFIRDLVQPFALRGHLPDGPGGYRVGQQVGGGTQ